MRLLLMFRQHAPELSGKRQRYGITATSRPQLHERILDATERLALLQLQARLSRGRYPRHNVENDTMNPEDVQRWKELERRAREHGWTIDLLEVHADRAGTPTAAKSATTKREFALMELGGAERVLTTGDLDAIEVFLKSSKP